jgi:hypothetical protein
MNKIAIVNKAIELPSNIFIIYNQTICLKFNNNGIKFLNILNGEIINPKDKTAQYVDCHYEVHAELGELKDKFENFECKRFLACTYFNERVNKIILFKRDSYSFIPLLLDIDDNVPNLFNINEMMFNTAALRFINKK